MTRRWPPGFPARPPPDIVLALPSHSGPASPRESQASVVGPARGTPPSSPEQYAHGQGQGDDSEQLSGYAAWDDIQVTPVAWPSPHTPPEYPPPPPLPYEEARQWTEAIVRDSQRMADTANELNLNAQQLAQAFPGNRQTDWKAAL